MKKRRQTPRIHSSHREYDSLVSRVEIEPETEDELRAELQAEADELEQHLAVCQREAEALLAGAGIAPSDYRRHVMAPLHGPVWIGAHMLLYLDALRRCISRNDARGAAAEAMRLEWCRTISFAKTWELDARIGRRQRTSEGGNSRAVTAERKEDWQRRFDELRKANPRLPKTRGADLIARALNDGTPANTIRQHIHKRT